LLPVTVTVFGVTDTPSREWSDDVSTVVRRTPTAY